MEHGSIGNRVRIYNPGLVRATPSGLIRGQILQFISESKHTSPNLSKSGIVKVKFCWQLQSYRIRESASLENHQVLSIIYITCHYLQIQAFHDPRKVKFQHPDYILSPFLFFAGLFQACIITHSVFHSPPLLSLNMSCSERSLVIHIKYSLVTFL